MLGWSVGGDHDPQKALNALETLNPNDPPEAKAFIRPVLSVLAAASLVRAGQQARANELILDAYATGGGNPELLNLEAGVRVLEGNTNKAVELLRTYLALRPESRMRVANSRIFAPLRTQSAFASLTSRPLK
jgi:Flp pilus assembly protein TadD